MTVPDGSTQIAFFSDPEGNVIGLARPSRQAWEQA
jgi:hypothetical protein